MRTSRKLAAAALLALSLVGVGVTAPAHASVGESYALAQNEPAPGFSAETIIVSSRCGDSYDYTECLPVVM